MKNFIRLAMVALALSASPAFAGKYGASGCGLGSQLFPENTKGMQILALTFNGSSGNQTFGISTGTSNCTDGGTVAQNAEIPLFVEVNKDTLMRDIARGQGTTLDTFAGMVGCTNKSAVGTTLQKNYGRIFDGSVKTTGELTDRLMGVIEAEPALRTSCGLQG